MQVELWSITPNAEYLIERAGRVCYRSEMSDSPDEFIRSLIRRGHESVIEHASATFYISGISRACSHQLVRHRLASYSQESQRYCEAGDWEPIIPPTVEDLLTFFEAIEEAKQIYHKLRQAGIPREDARFVLPNATPTSIVVTMNFRSWRHFCRVRCDKAAQWEIRQVACIILQMLNDQAPAVFGDLYKRFVLDRLA
jgi:thymidylate synthase (FAD)